MPEAEWVITFDDGPLPADVASFDGFDEEQILAPLGQILNGLTNTAIGPIPAVFFLRGPAFPWPLNPPFAEPPRAWFERGVQMIEAAGHRTAIHCHRHDPELWKNWPFHEAEIVQDLDRCVQYFGDMVARPLTALRPPYGQGGWVAANWAARRSIRFHGWDVDTEDWLHHPDAGLVRRYENDPDGHRKHILAWLPLRMALPLWFPGPKDFLLHVSQRTADMLPDILATVIKVTRDHGCTPRFVIPPDYV